MRLRSLNVQCLVGIDADQMEPQWISHTFEFSHKICEGGFASVARLNFGPPPPPFGPDVQLQAAATRLQ
jgi:hypothetical protein